MTENELRKIEINCNKEDISILINYIRHLKFMIERCREILK